MAEVLALRSAAVLISSLNVQSVIIESDCKELVYYFNNAVNVQWDCEVAVNDVREILRSVPAVSVCFAGRMKKKAANWLAKSCLKGMCPVDWVFRPLFPLEMILVGDSDFSAEGIG